MYVGKIKSRSASRKPAVISVCHFPTLVLAMSGSKGQFLTSQPYGSPSGFLMVYICVVIIISLNHFFNESLIKI